jgi:predicted RNase H-like nuclease (RuvC/YqgF family)
MQLTVEFFRLQQEEQERFRQQQALQEQQMLQSRMMDAHSQLEMLQSQRNQDKNTIQEFNGKIFQLEQQLQYASLASNSVSNKDAEISQLQG